MSLLLARLKRTARPAVSRLRFGLRRLGQRLWPDRPWDGRHHPVFEHFPPWRGESDGGWMIDFLGIRTDPRYRWQWRPPPAGPLVTQVPSPYAGYFELVAVLESVVEARQSERYTIIELGAGFGPWLVTAHRARALLGGRPARLVGLEMVPEHFAWLHEHLRRNAIDPSEHTLIQAAVSDDERGGAFLVENDPDSDFGQTLRRAGAADARTGDVVAVRTVTLRSLLGELDRVDLLHIDVQGEELRVLRHALGDVTRRVRRMVVATHSRSIHRRLGELLRSAGWQTVWDFPGRGRRLTEFGHVRFLDGLLVLRNERAG